MEQRRAGVERMLAEDAALFWRKAAKVTRQIDDWPMIRLLCEKAEATQDLRALPWLVRSWAMPSRLVTDDDRPEREAIESITGKPADHLLEIIVFGDAEQAESVTQVAAWTVLMRTSAENALRRQIEDSRNDALLLTGLKRAASAVDRLPNDRIEIARLMRLMSAHPDAHWEDWARWRDAHRDDGSATLALRHLPMLLHRDKHRDGWTREQWAKHLAMRLADRRHVSRGGSDDEDVVIQNRPDRFEDHVDQLGIADLMVLDHLLDAMADPAIARAAFEQAQADRVDTTTEYGGALTWNEQGEIVLKPFAPMMRLHDQTYLASSACINEVYLGLAHFHFHTQKYDNDAWAGPGKGDMDFADAQHANAIVFTFVDENTLNVDAYFPGGIAIDLGCVTR